MKNLLNKSLLTFFLITFLIQAAAPVRADDLINLEVNYNGSRRSSYMQAIDRHGVVYTSVEDLAGLMHLGYINITDKQKCILKSGSKGITVTAMNPFILVNKHPHQMALPTIRYKKHIYVPLAIFLNICREFLPPSVKFDPFYKRLDIAGSTFNITSVNIEERGNGTLIRLSTAKTFQKNDLEVIRNKNWLYVTFVGGLLDTLNLASDEQISSVRRIKSLQYDNSAQISFLLTSGVYEHDLYVNKNEVMISLRRSEKIRINARKPSQNTDKKKKWLIDTIIIDPGHGGPDPGAIGRYRKVKEKNVNLAIGTKLASLLRKNLKVKVLMTRTTDARLEREYRKDLRARPKFANSRGGKLFISIHANSVKSGSAKGFSVWVLGKATSQKALEVAKKENSVADDKNNGTEYQQVSHILNANANNSYQKESIDLARMMVKSIQKRTKLNLWTDGVEQANLVVLWGSAMPSVLVETAFLSNKHEERLLNTRAEQMKIARALYESIAEFKKKYDNKIGRN